ncbi:MAG: sacsin N-terminal ATP-binding-like domain-containing protein, partial [Nanoarchaeota archaeon]
MTTKVEFSNEIEQIEKIREGRLNSYKSSPQDINAHYYEEGQIQSDYHKRFIYELLQNADDALQTNTNDKKIYFNLSEDELIVANTGRPIEADDLTALCTMSYTTKSLDSENKASIGHKGRGFRSILEITDNPKIYSKGISFEFNRSRSKKDIYSLINLLDNWETSKLKGIPLMRLPYSLEDTPEKIKDLYEKGYNTVFAFPLKNDRVKQDIIAAVNRLDNNTILFLNNLEKLKIKINNNKTKVWNISKQSKEILSSDTSLNYITINQDKYAIFSKDRIEIGKNTGGIDVNTWGNVNYSQIGLGFKLIKKEDGFHFKPFENSPSIHVFLPTQEKSPIPLLINGAFHTRISRTHINVTADADNYNGFLLEEAVKLLTGVVRDYIYNQSATTPQEFISCLNFNSINQDNLSQLDKRIINSIKNNLIGKRFIPRYLQEEQKRTFNTISETILPFYSEENEEIAPAVIKLFGDKKIDIKSTNKSGYFPDINLLEPEYADILSNIGVDMIKSEEMPLLLDKVADENIDLIFPDSSKELVKDPLLQIIISIWKLINGFEEKADKFKENTKKSSLFPVNNQNADYLKHIKKEKELEFFFPPESISFDIEISGIRFFSSLLYRPKDKIDTKTQSKLLEDIKPYLESIWEVKDFSFEDVMRLAIFPKLLNSNKSKELENLNVLRLIYTLSKRSINEDNPLLFEERDGSLHRLCMLPVPTKNLGWQPAYKIYFSKEWQDEENEYRQVENLLNAADIKEAPLLLDPVEFEDFIEAEETKEDEGDVEENPLNELKSFFIWLGVSPHLKLRSFFAPEKNRLFRKTIGINRPENSSLLSELKDKFWFEYRNHLLESIENSRKNLKKYKSIYKMQNVEYIDIYLKKAGENKDFGLLLLKHILHWWNDSLKKYSTPVLATHNVKSFNRRNKHCPKSHEKRKVGINLWLWILRQHKWVPLNNGQIKEPYKTIIPEKKLKSDYSIANNSVLPFLSEKVFVDSPKERELLIDKLGIRDKLTTDNFKAEDLIYAVKMMSEWFNINNINEIEKSMRQIKPIYRYIIDILPPVRTGAISEEFKSVKSIVKNENILCEINELKINAIKDTYIVTSSNVINKLPFKNLPIFILKEERSRKLSKYIGLKDLENELTSNSVFYDENVELTKNISNQIEKYSPYILCRLEAERPSQDMIQNDIRNLKDFRDNLHVVSEIEVAYELPDRKTKTISQDYYNDDKNIYLNINDGNLKKKNQVLAKALCEYLDTSVFEALINILNADSTEEIKEYLSFAGAPYSEYDIKEKVQALSKDFYSDYQEESKTIKTKDINFEEEVETDDSFLEKSVEEQEE